MMEGQNFKKTRIMKHKAANYEAPNTQTNVEPHRVLNSNPRSVKYNRRMSAVPVSSTWLEEQSKHRGTDPSAPHLKYGVFPQRKSVPRGFSTTMATKPMIMPQSTSDYATCKRVRKKASKKGQLSEAPLLVFRTLDKRYTRHLSQSEILHVDIKPRRFFANQSPNYLNMSPRSLSSTNRSVI